MTRALFVYRHMVMHMFCTLCMFIFMRDWNHPQDLFYGACEQRRMRIGRRELRAGGRAEARVRRRVPMCAVVRAELMTKEKSVRVCARGHGGGRIYLTGGRSVSRGTSARRPTGSPSRCLASSVDGRKGPSVRIDAYTYA